MLLTACVPDSTGFSSAEVASPPQVQSWVCPGGVVPGVSRHAFKTPFSEGVQSFPVWRPWLDAADAENILFARCCGC